jgi:hypothetical protein
VIATGWLEEMLDPRRQSRPRARPRKPMIVRVNFTFGPRTDLRAAPVENRIRLVPFIRHPTGSPDRVAR